MSEHKPPAFSNALGLVVILQIALIITIIFNIPYARQALGFVYLTFVPGYAIQRLLRLKFSALEAVLFAVGLSIVFLMGEGFLLNTLGPTFGLSRPLDLNLILILTSVFVFSALIARRHDNNAPVKMGLDFKKAIVPLLILSVILILSIAGGLSASYSSNANSYLIFLMLGSIAALVGFVAFFRKRISPRIYPVMVFGVALALVLHVSLFTQYIVGFDIFSEYALFSKTLNNLFWASSYQATYNAMLSVTVLPTAYSVVLGLDGTWLFKIVYPAIFAFVPLGLYVFFKGRMSREVAFFSVIFFVSNIAFFTEINQLARQMIGELFYVLLLIILFSDKLKGTSKWLLFAIFSLGLIVSHYSLAYVFFASIAVVWLVAAYRKRHVKTVSGSMVVLFGVMTFAWFIYISSGAAFDNLMLAINSVRTSMLMDFFDPTARGTQVMAAVGNSGINTIWHSLGRFQFYIAEGLILVGVLAVFLKKRIKILNDDFNVLMLFNLVMLGACIVLPNFAFTFNASRFYHIALFLLAPLCVLGGIAALKFLSRNRFKRNILIPIIALLVIIPFFFFQTGFIYELAKDDSASLPLSAYRLNPTQLSQRGVVTAYEVSGASWLAEFQDTSKLIYSDINSFSVFGYAGISNGAPLTPQIILPSGSYVYFNQYNVKDGVIYSSVGSQPFAVNDIASSINNMNTIYSSGDCEIYSVP